MISIPGWEPRSHILHPEATQVCSGSRGPGHPPREGLDILAEPYNQARVKVTRMGVFLVVQWLRICLPVQGTQV